MRRCDTCRFYGPGEPAHCRRFPPVAVDGTNSTFPLVKSDWNCGERKRRWWPLWSRKKVKVEKAAAD